MKHTNWYKDAVIYQIYPRSFCDSNHDGMGDIPGIISKLDYLKDLGVNCVWLSPIYDSPQEDNGYDIANYREIYKPFGTLEDFKTMLDEMHKRGIRLIMDLVVNHTSSEHEWFKSAISDKNSPYRDYYIIRKGKGKNGKKPPNNWSGFFGGSTWERIGDTDEWYLHLFAKGQPDLNWENPKVREEVKDILRYWLDMGVDGFRCDVITLISKKQDFKNRMPGIALVGKDAYVNGPRLHEYLHELYTDVYANYDCMTVGETVLSSLDEAIDLVSPEREELDMVFNFDHTDTDNYMGVKWLYRKFKLKNLKKVFAHWQKGLRGKGWNSLFIENHDQRRSVGRFGTDDKEYRVISAKMLASMYFLLQGTPFIYQGQEIGMTNGDFESIDDVVDVEAHNIYQLGQDVPILRPFLKKTLMSCNRDNPRTPMQWDDTRFAGFSDVKPWLKVNKNKAFINAKAAQIDQGSIYNYFKSLIEFRKGNEVIRDGEYFDLLPRDNSIYAYARRLGEKEVVVVCSFSKDKKKCKILNELKQHKLVMSNYQEKDDDVLKPFEARIYINY
ncbi:MAG: alpha-glucosidase [Bacilli bacterium]|nr:alpha-glucosidase [Bacilli bacterium]